MTNPGSTLPPPSSASAATPDEQLALRARELYLQYAENQRAETAEPANKTPARRRAPSRTSRASKRGTRASTTAAPTHDEIAFRAHQLYQQAGSEPGREVEFWLEAERQLTSAPDA
jgi:hypothetical protein